MLDKWQRLSQGSRPVSECISKFDKFLSRCDLQEEESVILTHFRSGLKEDLQCELLLREVSTLQHAYQMVHELDSFSRFPAKRFDFTFKPTPSARPPQNQIGQS